MQLLDPLNKRDSLIERIIATFWRAGMATDPLEGDTDLGASTVPAINFHISGFANHHEIGANTLVFYERIPGDAVAPLFHIAKIVECPVFGQTQLFECGHCINHRRCGTLLIASAEAIDDSILEFALKWIPFPLRGIGHTYRIDMTIIE